MSPLEAEEPSFVPAPPTRGRKPKSRARTLLVRRAEQELTSAAAQEPDEALAIIEALANTSPSELVSAFPSLVFRARSFLARNACEVRAVEGGSDG